MSAAFSENPARRRPVGLQLRSEQTPDIRSARRPDWPDQQDWKRHRSPLQHRQTV